MTYHRPNQACRDMLIGLAIAAALVLLYVVVVHAKPPAGADPALAPWFQSLQIPGTGGSCCNDADCRTVQYRTVGNHFEAFIDRKTFGESAPDAWVGVPPEHVLHRRDNPTGEGVACWYNHTVLCFVEGNQT